MILIYNYQSQEQHASFSVDAQLMEQGELPCTVCCFKDVTTLTEYMLIGTTKGRLVVYDIGHKEFLSSSKDPYSSYKCSRSKIV